MESESKFFQVYGNFTIQILPSVLQDVFYELCGLTLRTIHDLRIPGASFPISQLLSLPGDSIVAQSGCPTLNASSTVLHRGFGCNDGEILRQGQQTLPECCKFACQCFTLLHSLGIAIGGEVGSYIGRKAQSTLASLVTAFPPQLLVLLIIEISFVNIFKYRK